MGFSGPAHEEALIHGFVQSFLFSRFFMKTLGVKDLTPLIDLWIVFDTAAKDGTTVL